MADLAVAVLGAVNTVLKIVEEIEETDKQASRLAKRLAAIKSPLQAIKEGNRFASAESLKQLLATVEEARTFSAKYVRLGTLERARRLKSNASEFAQLRSSLSEGIQALHFDVAVGTWERENALDQVEDPQQMERKREGDHKEIVPEVHALQNDIRSETSGWMEVDIEKDVDFEGSIDLGSGRFGKVCTAKWMGSYVAVKRLSLDGLRQEDVIRSLRKEVQLHSRLRFDFIVQLFAASTRMPELCLVMELAPGGSLHTYLYSASELLPHPLQVAFLYDVARGMRYMHRRNILHRDLKSANVLMYPHGRLKLCDFGLSKRKTGISRRSSLEVMEAWQWMSPEEMCGHPATELTDVYSFGVLCFEVATRAKPFSGMNVPQVIHAVATKGERPRIPKPSSPSSDVERLMERCWKQDPEERHPGFGPVVQKLSILWSRFGDPRVKNTPRVSFNPPSVLRISEHKTDIGEKVRSIQSANCGGSAATGVTTSSSQLTGRPGVKITPCISGGKTISASASREVASVPDEILSSHLTAMAIDVSAETHSAERGKPHESRETIRIPAPSNIKPPLQKQRAKRLQHTGSKVRRPKRENKVGKGKRDVSRETVSIPGSPDIDLLLHKQRVKSIEQNPSAVGRQPLTKKNRDLKNDLLHTRWQQLQMEVGKAKPQSSGDLSKISKLPDIESIGEKERIRRLLIQGKLAMATRDRTQGELSFPHGAYKRTHQMAGGVWKPKHKSKPGEMKPHVSRETVSIPGPPGIDLPLHKQRVKSIGQNPSAVGRQPLTKKNRELKKASLHTEWQQLQTEGGKANPQFSGDLSRISRLLDIESIGGEERVRQLLTRGELARATRDLPCGGQSAKRSNQMADGVRRPKRENKPGEVKLHVSRETDDPDDDSSMGSISNAEEDDPDDNLSMGWISSEEEDDPDDDLSMGCISSEEGDGPDDNLSTGWISSEEEDDPDDNLSMGWISSEEEDGPDDD